MSVVPLRRRVDLHDVELAYSSIQRATGFEPDDAIADWVIAITEKRSTDGPDDADYADNDEIVNDIGTVSVATFNLDQDVDWFDAGDARGGDLFSTCVETIFDAATGDLTDELTDELALYPGNVMLIDHITLAEIYRGYSLGVAIISAIIRHLGTHSTLVAAYPRPDGWQDLDPKAGAVAQAKIEQSWSRLRFAPYKNGLWLRSLSLTTGWADSSIEQKL